MPAETYKDVKVYGMTIKDELNPDLFNGTFLKPNVKKALMRISDEFHGYLNIDQPFDDVRIVGSSINYHWSAQSDVDLHVVFDFSKLPCPDDKEFIREYLISKKKVFNDRHDIELFGMEVELYPEDVHDDTKSTAIYSISKNLWIRKPNKVNVTTRKDQVRKLSFQYMKKIDALEKINDHTERLNKAVKIKDSLMSLRKKGLLDSGEYNFRNITYKTLRNANYIEKLFDYITESYDQTLSYPTEEENDRK